MRFTAQAWLGVLALVSGGASATLTHGPLRRQLSPQKQKNPCLVLVEVRHLDEDGEQESVVCELDEDDGPGLAYGKRIVKIEGFTGNELMDKVKKGEIVSGETTMMADGADLSDDKIFVPPGKAKFEKKGRATGVGNQSRRELAPKIGTQSVLVVRVIAADASTTSSVSTISDEVFGTSGDPFNLKSGYETCSHGAVTVNPATGTNVGTGNAAGTTTVTISNVVSGTADGTIREAVRSALNSHIPNWSSTYTLTMFCLPPGTAGGWIAYAYINHYLSVYNDNWCNYPSGQMHEIGHNLGLAHAGEGTAQYADQSGMMGYSYSQDDGPKMCFNGAKMFLLGWFPDAVMTLEPINGESSYTGDLIGVTDYVRGGSNKMVVIKIEAGATDYYVHFNRKTGINSGTVEGGDQVLVATAGDGYSQSWLLTKMSATGEYVIDNFAGSGKTLKIVVNSINTTVSPAVANVSIIFGNCSVDADCDDGLMCTTDTCDSASGVCSNTPVVCQGTFCGGGNQCNPSTGLCDNPAPTCDDGNLCTTDSCDAGTDSCKHESITCPDDNDFCNGQEVCDAGSGLCISQNAPQCPSNPATCQMGFCDNVSKSCQLLPASDPCCGDGVCSGGAEDCNSCPEDCDGGNMPGAVCGNGICEEGENCNSCSADCRGIIGGKPSGRFCCYGGPAITSPPEYFTQCTNSKCGGFCDTNPAVGSSYCCGDGVCEGPETSTSCPVDQCPETPQPVCGNGECEVGEDAITCPVDCSPPPPPPCGLRNTPCTVSSDCCNSCKKNGMCS